MAPRALWRGSITFGLITVPIKLFAAVGRTEEKLDLHLLHEKDGERIHYERRCDKGHKDIDWDEIVRGFEYQKGKWVMITDDELAALDLPALKTIDVMSFAPLEQIDPIYYDKTYYVVPDAGAEKAYHLMTDALEDEGFVGVCKVAMREREHLSALRATDGMLVLQTMHWPEEIRASNFGPLKKRPRIQDRERKMARQLITQLQGDFNPGEFKDDYHKALKKIINKKIKGEDVVVPESVETEPEGVIDLMEALKASVDEARSGGKKRSGPRRKRTSRRSASKTDLGSLSKDELIGRARELDIQGRSQMDKKQLVSAIRRAS
jgi:DNA end-binding protein Ku